MVHDVKHLQPELNVEILRNALNPIVLEDREIKAGNSWPNQKIAAGIAAEIETPEVPGRERCAQCRWRRIAIGVKEGLIRCHGNAKTLCLDVARGVAWICGVTTTRSAQAIRIGIVVAT